MKRSGSVGLVVMGAAAFAATFAGGMAYFAWQKPSHAAQAQSAPAQPDCAPRSDGMRTCEPQRRSFSYYVYPHWVRGWSWGWGSSYSQTQTAALSNNSRASSPPAASGTVRGGFGSTAGSAPYRVSAGG
ncbi:MAG: hypothetical protein E6G97_17585 [Alphaproteobacteria bacterium]|nr:MAG: hypothetical protein E6G97_17585 [Alphaproteobacteria bacterium]